MAEASIINLPTTLLLLCVPVAGRSHLWSERRLFWLHNRGHALSVRAGGGGSDAGSRYLAMFYYDEPVDFFFRLSKDDGGAADERHSACVSRLR